MRVWMSVLALVVACGGGRAVVVTPSAEKLCDCPTLDVPASCKSTDPAAANLYCCP